MCIRDSNYHRTGTKSTDFFGRSEYFYSVPHISEIPILCLLRRSFCAPVLKYKSAQILQLETQAKTCYNFYKISFIPLGTLVRYTDRKGGEAVEYSDHELVRGIKGGDKSALRCV